MTGRAKRQKGTVGHNDADKIAKSPNPCVSLTSPEQVVQRPVWRVLDDEMELAVRHIVAEADEVDEPRAVHSGQDLNLILRRARVAVVSVIEDEIEIAVSYRRCR